MTFILIASALSRFAPKIRIGKRYLKDQLQFRAVGVRVCDGCIADFVRNAIELSAHPVKTDESYLDRLRRELDACAQFILEWTGSDKPFEQEGHRALVAIARRYALPRSWKSNGIAANLGPSKRRREVIPEHLVRR